MKSNRTVPLSSSSPSILEEVPASGDTPQNSETGELPPDQVDQPSPPTDDGSWPGLKVCTNLDFSGISWSTQVPPDERDQFAVSLDLSGGFEGPNGWSNLSNNFDGQGVSMGLLNQNLGQGSLQPIWLDMRSLARERMRSVFGDSKFNSASAMLDKWSAKTSTSSLINISDYGFSSLDDPELVAQELDVDPLDLQETEIALLAHNQESVNWAVANLYSGSKFKSDWSKGLKDVSITPEYRSLQVNRAEKIHKSALSLMKTYGMWQFRSYLFFFDIMVQNGGISSTLKAKYFDWLKTHSSASETARLTQLLAIRLTVVRKQYVEDVRSRKMLTITGTGTVHGAKYNLEKDYCIDLSKVLGPQITGT